MFCFAQGSRIVVILTCLLNANKANQVEVSRQQAREESRKWEQETSFKAKKALHQQAEEARKTSQPTQTGRQILDPTVLKMISEQTEMAPISKKPSNMLNNNFFTRK